MAKHKSFKLHIDSVVALNLEGLDFSVGLPISRKFKCK